eukprot:2784018-Amphidinium_carterae.1
MVIPDSVSLHREKGLNDGPKQPPCLPFPHSLDPLALEGPRKTEIEDRFERKLLYLMFKASTTCTPEGDGFMVLFRRVGSDGAKLQRSLHRKCAHACMRIIARHWAQPLMSACLSQFHAPVRINAMLLQLIFKTMQHCASNNALSDESLHQGMLGTTKRLRKNSERCPFKPRSAK